MTLQNCTSVSERGFSHLAMINTIERLDFYRTVIETTALKEILKASPRLKHINLGMLRGFIYRCENTSARPIFFHMLMFLFRKKQRKKL